MLSLIVDEARALLSARAVLVLPVEGGDRASVEAALAEHGAEGVPSIVVPFERDAGTSLAAIGHEASNEDARELLDGLAAVGRSALSGVTARAGAASARRLDAVVGGVARKLAALHDSGAVAAALAAELRSRLPIESVGVRLGEEPERWYPAPAAPEEDRPRAEEVLVFDGFALGTVAYAPTRPLTLDEELLADRVIDAGALALGVAGLRSAAASSRPRRPRSCARPSRSPPSCTPIACCSASQKSCPARCTRTRPPSGSTSRSRSACA